MEQDRREQELEQVAEWEDQVWEAVAVKAAWAVSAWAQAEIVYARNAGKQFHTEEARHATRLNVRTAAL